MAVYGLPQTRCCDAGDGFRSLVVGDDEVALGEGEEVGQAMGHDIEGGHVLRVRRDVADEESHGLAIASAAELDVAEAALLVALPNAPTRLRPDLAPDRARARRDRILGRMLAAGSISREAHDAAPDVERADSPNAAVILVGKLDASSRMKMTVKVISSVFVMMSRTAFNSVAASPIAQPGLMRSPTRSTSTQAVSGGSISTTRRTGE